MHRLWNRLGLLLAGSVLAILLVTPVVTSAVTTSRYVAIAFSRSRVAPDFVGRSTTLHGAEDAALKLCRAQEKGCQGAVWVSNGWVAYASVSTPRGGEGFAYGSTKSFAGNLALHYFVVYGGDSRCNLRTDTSTVPLVPRLIKGGTW